MLLFQYEFRQNHAAVRGRGCRCAYGGLDDGDVCRPLRGRASRSDGGRGGCSLLQRRRADLLYGTTAGKHAPA